MISEEKLNQIVDEIVDDISDRSGIGDEWGMIDNDIQDEIKETWKNIIRNKLKKE